MTRPSPNNIRLKRVYRRRHRSDGVRILVDRLWPRGLSKEKAHIDHWMKDIAPSDELRKWFGHRDERWREFQEKYRQELQGHRQELGELRSLSADGAVTLLFAAKDEKHNNAVVVREWLVDHGEERASS